MARQLTVVVTGSTGKQGGAVARGLLERGRAALIAEITGRSLAFLAITEEQLRAGLTHAGLPVEVVNTVINLQTSFAAGAFDIVTGDVERLGGRPPKPLRDVLAGALKSPSA